MPNSVPSWAAVPCGLSGCLQTCRKTEVTMECLAVEWGVVSLRNGGEAETEG